MEPLGKEQQSTPTGAPLASELHTEIQLKATMPEIIRDTICMDWAGLSAVFNYDPFPIRCLSNTSRNACLG